MSKARKSFPLRISQELFDQIKTWSEQEMRSVNGQIEFLLREAVHRRQRGSVDPPAQDENDSEPHSSA